MAIAATLVGLAAIASTGIYNIDELGYILSAEDLRNTGGFVVENGRADFASLDLKVEMHVDGPQGMVSQYPVGTAWAAQPLMGLMSLTTCLIPGFFILARCGPIGRFRLGSREPSRESQTTELLGRGGIVRDFWCDQAATGSARWDTSAQIGR